MNATPFERAIYGAIVAVMSFGILLPVGIAMIRDHPKRSSIFAWNTLGLVLLGAGWFVALWQALSDMGHGVAEISATTTTNSDAHAASL